MVRHRVAPKFEPTQAERDLVKMAASVGVSQEQLRLMIKRPDAEGALHPISLATLIRHFDDELTIGKSQTIVLVAGQLVRTALAQNTAATVADALRAQMFYLKTQAGWREIDRQEITFPEPGEESEDMTAALARITGLIERGRRKQLKLVGGTDTDAG